MDNRSNNADFTPAELEEGLKALASLIKKCEKAEQTLSPGTPQMTTLLRRLKAFRMAYALLERERSAEK